MAGFSRRSQEWGRAKIAEIEGLVISRNEEAIRRALGKLDLRRRFWLREAVRSEARRISRTGEESISRLRALIIISMELAEQEPSDASALAISLERLAESLDDETSGRYQQQLRIAVRGLMAQFKEWVRVQVQEYRKRNP